ncbi:extensin-like domain-containing protein [Paracoccus zhouxuedongae]|uniref:extensin-like domain-containing protein n=1 Tax=Paracoccus sp. p4-l81 TaxID=3342806 RepID=UPI0035BC662B
MAGRRQLGAVLALMALLQATAADAQPRPLPRPEAPDAPDAERPAAKPAAAAAAPAPTPAPVPAPDTTPVGRLTPPAPTPATPPPPGGLPWMTLDPRPILAEPPVFAPPQDLDALTQTADDGCLADLRAMGTEFTPLPPITETTPGCGIAAPLRVDQVVPGVALHGGAVMRCETAQALARWTRDFVQPAARLWQDQGGAPLTGYRTGSTYACRMRVGDGSGKVSEHATGNAIDIAAFTFDGAPDLAIAPREGGNDMATAFQRAARGTACLLFSTVLGPGADDAHDDHLHLDIMPRRGGWRICQ